LPPYLGVEPGGREGKLRDLQGIFIVPTCSETPAIIQEIALHDEYEKYFQMVFPRFGRKWRLFEHAHASCPGLSFLSPGFNPYIAWEERRLHALGYVHSNGQFF